MTFDEKSVNRDHDGKFAEKTGTSPEVSLDLSEKEAGVLDFMMKRDVSSHMGNAKVIGAANSDSKS